MTGLSQQLIGQMSGLAACFGAQRLVLFGSRARGDFERGSDIDLAVYGMERGREMAFRDAIEDLPTLLKVDVVPVRKNTDALLLREIERDGVELWSRE